MSRNENIARNPVTAAFDAPRRDHRVLWERCTELTHTHKNASGEPLQRLPRPLAGGKTALELSRKLPSDQLVLQPGLTDSAATRTDRLTEALLDAIIHTGSEPVLQRLQQLYQQQGMRDYLYQTLLPGLHSLRDRWACGDLPSALYRSLVQQVQQSLDAEIDALQRDAKKPLVVLATLPGESRVLEIQVMAAMLSWHGISASRIGNGVPAEQIARVADTMNADAVGLSFGTSLPANLIETRLKELCRLLPGNVDVWIVGAGVSKLQKLPLNVTSLTDLEELPL